VCYATGQPAGVMDRPEIDRILAAAARTDYGLRSIIHAVVASELFQRK